MAIPRARPPLSSRGQFQATRQMNTISTHAFSETLRLTCSLSPGRLGTDLIAGYLKTCRDLAWALARNALAAHFDYRKGWNYIVLFMTNCDIISATASPTRRNGHVLNRRVPRASLSPRRQSPVVSRQCLPSAQTQLKRRA